MSELIHKLYTIEYFSMKNTVPHPNRSYAILEEKIIPSTIIKMIMYTSNFKSDHTWDAVNEIIQSLGKITDLNYQRTDLYDMEYIYLTKDKC